MGFNFLPKEDIECLGECYSQVLQSVSLNLSRAYLNFFADRAKYPRFKSRFRKQSIQYPQQIKQIDSSLKVPGRLVPLRVSQKSKVLIGKGFMIFGLVTYFRRAALEVVKAKIHRPLEGEIKTVTVSRRPQENILLLSCWKERKC